MPEPHWLKGEYDPIDYQDLYYYSAPENKKGPKSLDEVDPKIRETYEKLGIPLKEQEALAGVAVAAGSWVLGWMASMTGVAMKTEA